MREGVSDAPLAKCCGSRHGTANLLFCSPFSPVFGFLSRHIIGSAWFLFHWRALSEVQTVIYLVSPIPRIAPSVSPAPPACEISAPWQAYSDSRSWPGVPLGPVKRGRKDTKKYNRLYLLYSGTSALIRPERKEAPMTFQMMSGSSESSLVDIFLYKHHAFLV